MEGTRHGARRHRRRACGCPSNGFGLRGDNGALALDTGCVSDHCVSYCHPLCWLKGCFLSALLLLARGASSSAPLRRASVLPVWANDMHQRTAKATGARAREPSDYYSNSALTSATGHHASNPDTSTLAARSPVDDYICLATRGDNKGVGGGERQPVSDETRSSVLTRRKSESRVISLTTTKHWRGLPHRQ